jgi:hypothetical protein
MNKRTAELCQIYKEYRKEKYWNNSWIGKTINRSRHNPEVGMMPQRVHRGFFIGTGGFQCLTKSDLNAAIAYRRCGLRHVFAAMAGRREYPDFVSVAFPLFTQ